MLVITGFFVALLAAQYDDLPAWFRLLTASAVYVPLSVFSLVWAFGSQRTHLVRAITIAVVAISAGAVLATVVWDAAR